MANLTAKSPAAGLLPIDIGGLRLSEDPAPMITAILPFKGQTKAMSEAMKAAHGVGFPAPNRSTQKAPYRAIWTGLDQAFLMGGSADAALARHGAVVDQSDAWAVLILEGEAAEAALARLCPVDLRQSVFKRGHVARSLIGHMTAVIHRDGAARFSILVFRSMAGTAVHELETAMKGVVARDAAQ